MNVCNILSVWIEPLWNWNASCKRLSWLAGVFELNLYGIEIWFHLLCFHTKRCLNWTFMELKFVLANRTCRWNLFELNLYGIEIWTTDCKKVRHGVWIEPLWNWNIQFWLCYVLRNCLNWTFMELKYNIRWSKCITNFTFELNLYGIEIT